jgi:hypothetical protein
MEFEFKNLRKDQSQPIDSEGSMEKALMQLVETLQGGEPDREEKMREIVESQVFCSKCGFGFAFKDGWVQDTPANVLVMIKCPNCGADARCQVS